MLPVPLALTAGAADATAFERLGHVFASVTTGNLVVAGVSAVRGDAPLLRSSVCALAGGWELAHGRPGATAQLLLALVAAGAMGAQSTGVRRLGGFSTTYLTGTLTRFLEGVVLRRWSADDLRGAAILLTALVGAMVATVLILDVRRWLPVILLLPPLGVVSTSRLMR